jgi:ferredoxin
MTEDSSRVRPQVVVDRAECMGAGNCAAAAPLTFDTDDEGLVVLLDLTASSIDELRAAEQNCPSGAIRLT